MRPPLDPRYSWGVPEMPLAGSNTAAARWTCGFCGHAAASEKAYYPKFEGRTEAGHAVHYSIRVCGNCQRPTWLERDYPPVPAHRMGEDVDHLPSDVGALYDEMRDVTSVGAYTAAVLSARKILMHVAVDKGAPTNERFVVYVKFLGDKGYTPAGSEGWVDYIRKRSNDANHEIEIMTAEDAQALVTFTTQLLRNVYELPLSVPSFESGEPEEAGEEEQSAQE